LATASRAHLLRAAGTLTATARYTVARGATLRTHLVNLPARLARPRRRPVLHLPAHWPRAQPWLRLRRAVFVTWPGPPRASRLPPHQQPDPPTSEQRDTLDTRPAGRHALAHRSRSPGLGNQPREPVHGFRPRKVNSTLNQAGESSPASRPHPPTQDIEPNQPSHESHRPTSY
jgi:hypothetical protein